MTITAQTSKTGPYNGNGTTTVFSYTFEVQDEAHLVVDVLAVDGITVTRQVLNVGYTVTGVGNPAGGSIIMASAPGVGEKLTITRAVPIDQEIDLENRRSVAPEVLEDGFDKLTQIAQDHQEQLDRTIKVDLFDTADLDQLILNINSVAAIEADVSAVAAIDGDVPLVAAIDDKVVIAADNVSDITNFADVYLGPAAADPATRTDGSALQAGDLYFNTGSDQMRIYSGSAWVNYEAAAVAAKDAAELAQTNAETAETNAETAETGAVAARVAAETAEANAAAAAAMSGTIYADEATGRAAVADGEFYLAVGSTSEKAVDVWRRDDASNSTLMRSYADLSVVQEIVELMDSQVVGPTEPLATGTAVTNTVVYYWPTSLETYDQYVYEIETGATSACVFNAVVAFVEGDGSLTLVSVEQVSVATGRVTTPVDVLVPAGCVFGLGRVSGDWLYTPGTIAGGESAWYTSGLPTTSTAKTIATSNGVHYRASLRGRTIHEARIAYADAHANALAIGSEEAIGWADPVVATGSDAPSTYAIIIDDAVGFDGFITGLKVGAASAGSATVQVVEMSGNTVTVISSTPITLSAGVTDLDLAIPVEAGQYVGLFGGSYKFQNSSNPEGIRVWIKNSTIPATGDTLTPSTVHRFEVQFEVSWGHEARIRNLETQGTGDGTQPLADVDNTGATDVTSDISAAQNAHPHPYARPGTYQVTSIPKRGVGLWGPGKLVLDSKDYILPPAPMQGSLYEALRLRLAACVGTGAPLILIGDSISHWAFADTAADHFFDKLTAFANIEHSPDDLPIMTSFGNISTYTPAFYGVSFTGTTSGGTRGPIGDATAGSVVLAAGATLTFTGTFEEIAFSYVQEPSAGTITVKRDATTLTTINADSTLSLDEWSGLISTGVTVSATYTLECSVGSVEITSLLRRGVRAATDIKRLNTFRAARGSFTFLSFGADEVASILKIASHLSAEPPSVMIALGVNDAASVTTAAAMKARVDTLVDALQAGGVTDIVGFLPARPQGGSWPSRTANFDAVLAGLVQSYRAQGVQIIPQAYDYVQAGLAPDNLHPNTAGQEVMFRQIVENLAGTAG